jgi:hypothetical protein
MIPFSVLVSIRDMQSAKRATKQPFVNKRDHELIQEINQESPQTLMKYATGQEKKIAVR